MLWLTWPASRLISSSGFRLALHRSHIPQTHRAFSFDMKRKAEVLEKEEFGATPPVEEVVSTSNSDQTRKKERTSTWKGKDKNGGKCNKPKAGRRRGRRYDDPTEGEVDRPEAPGDRESKAPRLPKRQSALLISFCGTGYSGMQYQPDVPRTIEGTLFHALVKAGAVSQDNADDPVKVNLARAARTDAGVHATGNVVSMKVITSVPDTVARINELLPPEIRLWEVVRVQNSFNARIACDSRKYTYYFPSYILLPPKPGSGFDRTAKQHGSSLQTDVLDYGFWKGHESLTKEEDLERKRAWRVNSNQVVRLREIASKFEGTHNFHNFTVGREFKDRSNQRHMKKIEVADPVLHGNTEWIGILFHGQSFMLHQRKMMTALVMTCRTGTPSGIIDELYGPRVVLVPKMPSLGLLLEEPVFESYNGRMAIVNEKLHPSDGAYRPPIDFDLYRDQIIKFKDDFIYKNMRQVEDQTGLFDAWMQMVDSYSGKDLLYFSSNGTIPEAAMIEKGVKSDNPFREKKQFNMTGFATTEGRSDTKLQENEDEDEDEGPLVEEEGWQLVAYTC